MRTASAIVLILGLASDAFSVEAQGNASPLLPPLEGWQAEALAELAVLPECSAAPQARQPVDAPGPCVMTGRDKAGRVVFRGIANQPGTVVAWYANGPSRLQILSAADPAAGLVRYTEWWSNLEVRERASFSWKLDEDPPATQPYLITSAVTASEVDWDTLVDGDVPEFAQPPSRPDEKRHDTFLPHGVAETFWPDGSPRARGTFKRGLADGFVEHWYASGRPQSRVQYVDGFPHGPLLAWDEDGTPAATLEMRHGVVKTKDDKIALGGDLTATCTEPAGGKLGIIAIHSARLGSVFAGRFTPDGEVNPEQFLGAPFLRSLCPPPPDPWRTRRYEELDENETDVHPDYDAHAESEPPGDACWSANLPTAIVMVQAPRRSGLSFLVTGTDARLEELAPEITRNDRGEGEWEWSPCPAYLRKIPMPLRSSDGGIGDLSEPAVGSIKGLAPEEPADRDNALRLRGILTPPRPGSFAVGPP